MKRLSVVVPCYNEETTIPLFYQEFCKVEDTIKQQGIDCELVFVDDGSSDATLEKIKELQEENSAVSYVSFSRNFGKESAIYAGLERASGDYVAIMDADLQDPPSVLPQMLTHLQEGYDCVATRRVTRKGEPPIRSFFARQFYRIINHFSEVQIVDGARDYRVMTRQMVDAILSLSEKTRFSKGIFSWVGFKTKWLEYENKERVSGETSWSFRGLFSYALDGIFSFTSVPLTMVYVTGILFCFVALAAVVFIVIRKIFFGDPTPGWPSMVSIILLIGGIQLLCVGILGQYLSKVYTEVKNRPLYVVKEEK